MCMAAYWARKLLTLGYMVPSVIIWLTTSVVVGVVKLSAVSYIKRSFGSWGINKLVPMLSPLPVFNHLQWKGKASEI